VKRPLLLISGLFAKALVYYLALLGLWMVIGETYANAYRASATKIFRKFPPHGTVFVTVNPKPTRLLDSELRLGNDETRAWFSQTFSARYHGYAPMRLVLSLILASPFPWRRRGWAVLWGLVLIHAWIVFELFLMILDGYTGDHAAAMFTYNPTIMNNVKWIVHVAVETIVPRYVIPTVVWILVMFRRGDWDNFVKMLQVDDKM
jgi:hypothetical protein